MSRSPTLATSGLPAPQAATANETRATSSMRAARDPRETAIGTGSLPARLSRDGDRLPDRLLESRLHPSGEVGAGDPLRGEVQRSLRLVERRPRHAIRDIEPERVIEI